MASSAARRRGRRLRASSSRNATSAVAGLVVAPSDDRIRSSIDEGRLFVWETNVPVTMAGHSTIVATPGARVGRIGPV